VFRLALSNEDCRSRAAVSPSRVRALGARYLDPIALDSDGFSLSAKPQVQLKGLGLDRHRDVRLVAPWSTAHHGLSDTRFRQALGERCTPGCSTAQGSDRERRDHQALRGACGDERDLVDALRLSDAIDAAGALLEPRRMPGQLVVHDDPAVLMQVQPLGCGIGGEEDHSLPSQERRHETSLRRIESSVQECDGTSRRRDPFVQARERVPILCKDNDWLANSIEEAKKPSSLGLRTCCGSRCFGNRLQPSLLTSYVREAGRAERVRRRFISQWILVSERQP
jgi:hypothetical protein